MGIIYGLLSSLFFAFGFTALKKSYEEFPPSVAFFFDMVFGLLIWIPFALLLGFEVDHLLIVAPFAFISAILSEAFVFYVLSKGEISITGTIFASYPVYTILFAVALLGERLQPVHWLFVLITLAGTTLASIPKEFSKKELKQKQYIFWAVAGAVAVGISDTISKGSIDQTSAAAFLFMLALMQVPISLIYLKLEDENPTKVFNYIKEIKKYKFAALGSFFNVLGLVGLWLAFENTYASIASPLTAAYPGVMIILAVVLLKEKPRIIELIGLAGILIGVIGISYFYA